MRSSTTSPPLVRLPLSGRVFSTCFSCGPCSPSLLALGMRSSIVLLQIRFPEEDDQGHEGHKEGIDVQVIREIHHDSRVQCLSWPHTVRPLLSSAYLTLCSGGADGKVRVFRLTCAPSGGGEGGENADEQQTLTGHSDCVNSVAFEPETSEQVASASDDGSLILHRLDNGQRHVVTFGSPVMSVTWHPSEDAKLLVAEKSGNIHILNSTTHRPILSFDAGCGPLSCADWSLKNSLFVLAAIRSEIYVWDISKPCTPVLKKTVHDEGVKNAKFSHTSEATIATSGQPNYSVKVFNGSSSHTSFSSSDRPIGGISWHPRLNYLAIGRDNCVTLHNIPVQQ